MLLFIRCNIPGSLWSHLISKHLMLLFIIFPPAPLEALPAFQNILCYCLSELPAIHLTSCVDFKTSYVIVYPKAGTPVTGNLEFQNILCYCLSHHGFRCTPDDGISKHLMLLFIPSSTPLFLILFRFQNILCYCLSSQVTLMQLSHSYFKTSYVIVYRDIRIGANGTR